MYCIADDQFNQEKIDVCSLTSNQLSKLFKCKELKKNCPFDKSITMRDLYTGKSSKEDERLFIDQPHIWQNFRKGMTLLNFTDSDSNSINTVIGRKGLNKIYNLNANHVDRTTRYNTKSSKYDPINYFSTKNLILAAAKKCFLTGTKVEVVKQIVPNGSEVHFSWSKDARSWVIG